MIITKAKFPCMCTISFTKKGLGEQTSNNFGTKMKKIF